MRHTSLTIIQIFAILFYANAQNNSICLVKYKDLKTATILGTHNYWFSKDKLVSINVPNNRAIYMGGFPVIINNAMTTQTDTVKYNKEFNEFINDRKEDSKNRKERVITKDYNSDILKSAITFNDINKNYIVLDTLAKMDNWQILDDTLTMLGYKCQKATINYKKDNYTAWFTKQLPYNAGPDFFRGLPGLILKVKNTSGKFGYEALEIQTAFKGMVPKFDEIGEPISQTQWLAIANERRKKTMETVNNLNEQLKTPEGKESIINQLKKEGVIQKP